jgi:SAM-dependent methyltransferase
LGKTERPAWYLDPIVAEQKRAANLALVRQALRWSPAPRRMLKTDLFEDAFGDDQLLGEFPVTAPLCCGIDIAGSTLRAAQQRFPFLRGQLAEADLRCLPFRAGSFDFIVSTSSLDHFASAAEMQSALAGLLQLLAPGGVALLTFDNPGNPLYRVLRWSGRLGFLPFSLGYAPTAAETRGLLTAAGLQVREQVYYLHNPRGLSTLLVLGLRRAFGAAASPWIRRLLKLFAGLERLGWSRRTACFHATIAQR